MHIAFGRRWLVTVGLNFKCFVSLPVSSFAKLSGALHCSCLPFAQLLLTQDVKKYCIPEVINERLVQGVVSLLRANSEARFDSVVEAGPALAAEAAGIARDVRTIWW